MSNWIEKAGKEIDDKYGGTLCVVTRKEQAKENADIILSHAPVIDEGEINRLADEFATMSRWDIHKKDCGLLKRNIKAKLKEVVLCTPVIYAEKLAEKVVQAVFIAQRQAVAIMVRKRAVTDVAQLITSNLDLSITWVDGKAEWGDFRLRINNQEAHTANYYWTLGILSEEEGRWVICKMSEAEFTDQELAQAACVDALKRIVTGVKE